MAYTKYSLTPANNNAAPPDGAPEGMLPSAVNDTMRDMMAQIRDCGDGIRGGTYTMTAPVITGGSINGATIGESTASTGKFTSLQSLDFQVVPSSGTAAAGRFYAGTSTSNVSFLQIGAESTYTYASSRKDGSGTFLPYKIYTSDTERVTVTAAGDMGINTNSPAAKLHVVGSSLVTSNSFFGDSSYYASLSSSNPILSFDANDYILYNRTSNYLQTVIGGTERCRIDSSGNVGIGNAGILNVNQRLAIVGAKSNQDSASQGQVLIADTTAFNSSPVAGIQFGVKWNSSGSIAVGCSVQGIKDNSTDGNFGQSLVFTTQANGASPTEKMRITSEGVVLIGKSTGDVSINGFRCDQLGVQYWSGSTGNSYHVYNTASSAFTAYTSYTGVVYYTALSQLSDAREKQNIRYIDLGLKEILKLTPRKFDWADGHETDVVGFVAQEVEEVLPTFISEFQRNETETRKSLRSADLIPLLVKSIQEQQIMIDELKAKVAALEAA